MMNGINGFNNLSPDPQSPPARQNSTSTAKSNISIDPPTPTRTPPSVKGLSLSPPIQELSIPLSPALSNPDSSFLDSQSPQWSSAIGRAQTGKSGRVIEKLMAENDRLRRELKVESHKREEEMKRGEFARGKLESLQTTNEHLVQGREIDRAALARRDRKLEELKADLDAERSGRIEAVSQLKIVQKESEQSIHDMRQIVKEETERAKRATSQYEVLSASWRQLDEGYRKKTERLKKDLVFVEQERKDDKGRLERLEVTIEQQRQEVEKMKAARDGAAKEFQSYKDESEASTRGLRETAERNEKANTEALEETMRVLGQMRHIINVKKFVKDADIDGEASEHDSHCSDESSST